MDSPVDSVVSDAADELRFHLATGRQVDGALLGALRGQTEAVRLQDRQYGAGLLLEQMRGHVQNLERHLAHTVFDAARIPLAQVLADAAALAGWQALDVGGIDQAWRAFEIATSASRQAGDPALYAFARLEQAHVLAELDRKGTAADLAESVWVEVHPRVAPSVRCWTAAATAEMLALDGRVDAARSMIARAEADAAGLDGERPPYLVFDATHLNRWLGHTLVEMSDRAGEARLRSAVDAMDPTFRRASAALTLDLAAAVLLKGDREEGSALISQGEGLARQVGSLRQLKRAQKLRTAS